MQIVLNVNIKQSAPTKIGVNRILLHRFDKIKRRDKERERERERARARELELES